MNLRDTGSDTGATIVEWVALGALAAVIIAGLASVSVTHSLDQGVTAVVCRIVQAHDCRTRQGRPVARPKGSAQPSTPPTATPQPRRTPAVRAGVQACDRGQTRTEQGRTSRFVGYRRDTKTFHQLQTSSNGTVTETTGSQTSNGADVRVGAGIKRGKVGAGITGGGGEVSTTRVQVSLQFTGAPQRTAYNLRVQQARAALAKAARDPAYARTHDVPSMYRQIPVNVAHQLHIPRTQYRTDGSETIGAGEGSYGVGSANSTEKESDAAMTGRSINDNGTADHRDDIRTDNYERTVTNWSGSVGLAGNPLKKLGVPLAKVSADAKGTLEETEGYQLQWQYGKPIALTITRRRGWTITGGGGAGLGKSGKQGKQPGTQRSASGNRARDIGSGSMTVEKKTIDLRKDPAALAIFRKLNQETTWGNELWVTADPASRDVNVSPQVRQERHALQWHFDHNGQDLRQTYSRDYATNGSSMDVTDGLQIGARETLSSRDDWTLNKSEARDPRTRAWRPYTCATPPTGGGSW